MLAEATTTLQSGSTGSRRPVATSGSPTKRGSTTTMSALVAAWISNHGFKTISRHRTATATVSPVGRARLRTARRVSSLLRRPASHAARSAGAPDRGPSPAPAIKPGTHLPQGPGNEVLVALGAHADDKIKPLLDQVHPTVRQIQRQIAARIGGEEVRHDRTERVLAENMRRRDPDATDRYAAMGLQRPLHPFDLGQDPRGMVERDLARIGNHHRPCCPIEQAQTRHALHLRHPPAERGRWDAKRLRCAREAQLARKLDQDPRVADVPDDHSISNISPARTGLVISNAFGTISPFVGRDRRALSPGVPRGPQT